MTQIKSRLQTVIKDSQFFDKDIVQHFGNTLLNVIDVGGQPGFLEMLPALSSGPAMYLVFTDLSKELDKLYEIPFDRDGKTITPYKSVHTVKETLSQVLATVANCTKLTEEDMSSQNWRDKEFQKRFKNIWEIHPLATIVGTHLDQLDDQNTKLNKINDEIDKIIKSFPSIICRNPATDCPCLFPVDNLNGTDQFDIAPMRRFLSEIFGSYFKDSGLRVEKTWVLFIMILRREFVIANLEDCIEIGKELRMDEGDVKFCLRYISTCVGTLLYYPDLKDEWFKNHVLCSPQVIFDSISQLILASLLTVHSDKPVPDHIKRDLIERGQFSLKFIEQYCKEVDQTKHIPPEKLIKLLQHVNLLSPITSPNNETSHTKTTYLMPAVLESAPEHQITTPYQTDENHPPSLHITFETGYVPTGLFCSMVTKLVSLGPKGIFGLKWSLVQNNVKRNRISFSVSDVHRVTLLSFTKSIEIRLSYDDADPDPDPDPSSVHDICSYVLSVILYVIKILYSNIQPQVSFQCPCSEHQQQSKEALCTFSCGEKHRFICCSGKAIKLERDQQIWIGTHLAPKESAELTVLRHAKIEDYSFCWTKEGSMKPIPTDEPNVIRFSSVSDRDFGHYKCEITEHGRLAFTVYKALYKLKKVPVITDQPPSETEAKSGTTVTPSISSRDQEDHYSCLVSNSSTSVESIKARVKFCHSWSSWIKSILKDKRFFLPLLILLVSIIIAFCYSWINEGPEDNSSNFRSPPLSTFDSIPDLPTIRSFPVSKDKSIDIAQKIAGMGYERFATLLLHDEDGVQLNIIKENEQGDSVQIVCEVITKWLHGGGATWRTLVATLRQSGLLELANQIETNLNSN